MTKFSNFIRNLGTAGPPTLQGIYDLGFALRSEIATLLGKFVRVDQVQTFTGGEQQQGRENINAQQFSASLTSLAGVTTAADRLAYTTALDTWAVTPFTAFARTILDDANAAAVRTTIGLGNVDNTSDANKPVSIATQAALDLKVNTSDFANGVTDFVRGLVLSNNATDAVNDIDISIGSAKAGALVIVSGSSFGKRLDALWAAGGTPASPVGGLDTGSKTNGATYRIWALRNNTTGAPDFIFSTSLTAAGVNAPSGYSVVAPGGRDIGQILVDGAGTIRPFIQDGNDFYWNTLSASLPSDLSTTATRAKAALTITVPNGRRVQSVLQLSLSTSSGDSEATFTISDGSNPNIEKTNRIYASTAVKGLSDTVLQYTNTTAQVNVGLALTSTAATACTVKTLGFNDYTIPRI